MRNPPIRVAPQMDRTDAHHGFFFDGDDDENVVRAYVEAHLESHLKMGKRP